jgi:hypothetical protein
MLETTAMSDRGNDAARWLAAARAGSKEALGQMLADGQAYLLLIAKLWLRAIESLRQELENPP